MATLVKPIDSSSRPRTCEDVEVLRPGVGAFDPNGANMSKRARKRRSRKGNGANHGRRPNA